MPLTITASIERWPVRGQFVIARGAKHHVDVLVVGVSDGRYIGLGEGTAIYYEGESAEACLAQVMAQSAHLESMTCEAARQALQGLLPAGAARNALDCALWDLAAKAAGIPLWQFIGLKDKPRALTTAFTISLGEPAIMARDAAWAVDNEYYMLKLKLSGEQDLACVAAVRRAAPYARLIVDANESWSALNIAAHTADLAAFGVEMAEQPVSSDKDELLLGLRSPLALIADESCHNAADVVRCGRYYDGINIKLDKAGGLTEALKMADAAQGAGLKIMVGCMLCTSLAIAPAFILAQRADWVDLDGPALLSKDRDHGFNFGNGLISPR